MNSYNDYSITKLMLRKIVSSVNQPRNIVMLQKKKLVNRLAIVHLVSATMGGVIGIITTYRELKESNSANIIQRAGYYTENLFGYSIVGAVMPLYLCTTIIITICLMPSYLRKSEN